jgi:hypothetical protein
VKPQNAGACRAEATTHRGSTGRECKLSKRDKKERELDSTLMIPPPAEPAAKPPVTHEAIDQAGFGDAMRSALHSILNGLPYTCEVVCADPSCPFFALIVALFMQQSIFSAASTETCVDTCRSLPACPPHKNVTHRSIRMAYSCTAPRFPGIPRSYRRRELRECRPWVRGAGYAHSGPPSGSSPASSPSISTPFSTRLQ